MSVVKLPTPDPNLPRNGFDLSSRRIFSAPAGALLPVGTWEVNPNEHFEISVQDLVRTQPLNTAAFARCKEYYHFFFVPYRALWNKSDQFFVGVSNSDSAFVVGDTSSKGRVESNILRFGSVPVVSPSFSLFELLERLSYSKGRLGSPSNPDIAKTLLFDDRDVFGYSYSDGAYRLLNMLGYGVNVRGEVMSHSGRKGYEYARHGKFSARPNAFRAMAYQRIYHDFYRNPNWEKGDAYSFNCDYFLGFGLNDVLDDNLVPRMFQLRYRQWSKDWLTSALPSPMYDGGIFNLPKMDGVLNVGLSKDNRTIDINANPLNNPINTNGDGIIRLTDIRAAFALEKMLDATRRANGLDYSSQIQAHFGFKVPESRRPIAQFIGGFDNTISIGEVITTANGSLDGKAENSAGVGQIFGKGIGSMNSDKITYDTQEHGLIMCIYSVAPQVDYNATYLDPFNRKLTREDYYQPEFANLGLSPLVGYDVNLYASEDDTNAGIKVDSLNNSVMGYVPRYQEYKTARDVVFGEFQSALGLSAWTSPRPDCLIDGSDGEKFHRLTPASMMVHPAVLNPIFSVEYNGKPATDQFMINSYFDIKVVRPMSVHGLPTL